MYYISDAEMEEEEVAAHVDGSSQTFRDRLNGGDRGKLRGLQAWPCDLALYALKTDVLVVLLDTQRVSVSNTDLWNETKAFEELWFDPAVDSVKNRVICIVMDMGHFEFAVVRTPTLRFIFDLGSDWDQARSLILSFIKQRAPNVPLGPKWEPPVGSAFAISLLEQRSNSIVVSTPVVCPNEAAPRTPSCVSFPNHVPLVLATNFVPQVTPSVSVVKRVRENVVLGVHETTSNNSNSSSDNKTSKSGAPSEMGGRRGGREDPLNPINSENLAHIDLIDLGPKSKVQEVDLQKGIAQGPSARGATGPATIGARGSIKIVAREVIKYHISPPLVIA